MAESEDTVPSVLLPCNSCGRTFRPDALSKHTKYCEKSLIKKRKVFDSAKQRIQGTDLAEFLPVITQKKKYDKSPIRKTQSKWKEKHMELVRAIRAARVCPSDGSTPATSVKPVDHEKCLYCERYFGPKAYDRHLDWCKEHSTRIQPKNPASIQAKERLEARTKYKAPLLNKTRRASVSEKCSPKNCTRDPSPADRLTRARSSSLSSRSVPSSTRETSSNDLTKNMRSNTVLDPFRRNQPARNSRRSISPMKKKTPDTARNKTVNINTNQNNRNQGRQATSHLKSETKKESIGPSKTMKDDIFKASCNISAITPGENRKQNLRTPTNNRMSNYAKRNVLSTPKTPSNQAEHCLLNTILVNQDITGMTVESCFSISDLGNGELNKKCNEFKEELHHFNYSKLPGISFGKSISSNEMSDNGRLSNDYYKLDTLKLNDRKKRPVNRNCLATSLNDCYDSVPDIQPVDNLHSSVEINNGMYDSDEIIQYDQSNKKPIVKDGQLNSTFTEVYNSTVDEELVLDTWLTTVYDKQTSKEMSSIDNKPKNTIPDQQNSEMSHTSQSSNNCEMLLSNEGIKSYFDAGNSKLGSDIEVLHFASNGNDKENEVSLSEVHANFSVENGRKINMNCLLLNENFDSKEDLCNACQKSKSDTDLLAFYRKDLVKCCMEQKTRRFEVKKSILSLLSCHTFDAACRDSDDHEIVSEEDNKEILDEIGVVEKLNDHESIDIICQETDYIRNGIFAEEVRKLHENESNDIISQKTDHIRGGICVEEENLDGNDSTDIICQETGYIDSRILDDSFLLETGDGNSDENRNIKTDVVIEQNFNARKCGALMDCSYKDEFQNLTISKESSNIPFKERNCVNENALALVAGNNGHAMDIPNARLKLGSLDREENSYWGLESQSLGVCELTNDSNNNDEQTKGKEIAKKNFQSKIPVGLLKPRAEFSLNICKSEIGNDVCFETLQSRFPVISNRITLENVSHNGLSTLKRADAYDACTVLYFNRRSVDHLLNPDDIDRGLECGSLRNKPLSLPPINGIHSFESSTNLQIEQNDGLEEKINKRHVFKSTEPKALKKKCLPLIKRRRNNDVNSKILKGKRPFIESMDTYDPYKSAERQMKELLGLSDEDDALVQSLVPQPPVLNSLNSAFVKFSSIPTQRDPDNSSNRSSDFDLDSDFERLEAEAESRTTPTSSDRCGIVDKNFNPMSLSTISLCSTISIESFDNNKNNLRKGISSSAKVQSCDRKAQLPLQRSVSVVETPHRRGRDFLRNNLKMEHLLFGVSGNAYNFNDNPLDCDFNDGSSDNKDLKSSNEKLKTSNSSLVDVSQAEQELLKSVSEFEKLFVSSSSLNPYPALIPSSSPASTLTPLDHIDNHRSQASRFITDSAYNSLNRKSPQQESSLDNENCSSGSECSLSRAKTTQSANFCHECGAKFPVLAAKFCCNCGVRRLLI